MCFPFNQSTALFLILCGSRYDCNAMPQVALCLYLCFIISKESTAAGEQAAATANSSSSPFARAASLFYTQTSHTEQTQSCVAFSLAPKVVCVCVCVCMHVRVQVFNLNI